MFEPETDEPFGLFDAWLAEAEKTEPGDAGAVALATVSADGWPSVRMVLMRGRDKAGVHFHTNYTSPKAADIEATGRAALCFHWKSLGRQIRMAGEVARLDEAESDAYFASRPSGSRLAAWASRQSREVEDRAALDAAFAACEKEYPDGEVPRPPFWGGFRLRPHMVEFWQQGEYRLHDRFRFSRDSVSDSDSDDGPWRLVRLYP